MIESVTFEAFEDGPTLVVLGAVHGNEPCAPQAIRSFIQSLSTGAQKLQKGRVIFVPVCNPQAFAQNIRQIDRNLNRSLYPKENKIAYEDHIDPILCRIMDEADYLIDIHSFTDPGTPYVLVHGNFEKDIEFASQLGLPDLIYGWAEAYAASGYALDPLENQGTTEYARLNGKTISVTVECGQHVDPASIGVAQRIISSGLRALGMIEGKAEKASPAAVFAIKDGVFKAREGDFIKQWRNLEPVTKGDIIARYDDGETLAAPYDGYILLSKPWAKPGGEWYNLAIKETDL